jgi:hypothetical protein
MLILKKKPPLGDFVQTCSPLFKIPELENAMHQRVEEIVRDLLAFEPETDPIKNLTRFLQDDPNFLGVLLALTNLSQEKFLRILTAERFAQGDFGKEWNADQVFNKMKRDATFAERIARLFLEGRNSDVLVRQVADFYLAQLSLPQNWDTVIRDRSMVENVVRKKLTGEYIDQKGAAIESLIRSKLDLIRDTYGVEHEHGQVKFLGKEVDHAIPTCDNPFVLVMASYMETTSSSQTARANEQQAMYQKIIGENVRYGTKRIFVNVVDGAGWLARRSDLRKLHDGCDYCLSLNTLDQLEAIVCHYVPAKFFKSRTRPAIELEK